MTRLPQSFKKNAVQSRHKRAEPQSFKKKSANDENRKKKVIRELFDILDKNDDDAVTREEVIAGIEDLKLPGDQTPMGAERAGLTYDYLSQGKQKLTEEESVKHPVFITEPLQTFEMLLEHVQKKKVVGELFDILDKIKNDDGEVTREEVIAGIRDLQLPGEKTPIGPERAGKTYDYLVQGKYKLTEEYVKHPVVMDQPLQMFEMLLRHVQSKQKLAGWWKCVANDSKRCIEKIPYIFFQSETQGNYGAEQPKTSAIHPQRRFTVVERDGKYMTIRWDNEYRRNGKHSVAFEGIDKIYKNGKEWLVRVKQN